MKIIPRNGYVIFKVIGSDMDILYGEITGLSLYQSEATLSFKISDKIMVRIKDCERQYAGENNNHALVHQSNIIANFED